jgi:hypothetical protein
MSDETVVKTRKQKSPSAPSKHSITIRFEEAEDIELYDRLVDLAKADFRRPLDQYILLSLHTAFKQEDVPSIEIE